MDPAGRGSASDAGPGFVCLALRVMRWPPQPEILSRTVDLMPRIYIHPLTVTEDVIDVQRHVNNLTYLRWMQDVAIQHSTAQGWSMERYVSSGTGWVVRSHYIEYLQPAFLGEELSLLTWVGDLRRQSSKRRYLFWRPADQRVVARAETVWVFVDLNKGKPVPIPEELRTAFELVPEGEDVLHTTGLVKGAGPA